MKAMKGSDMEISAGNKQLRENKHSERHSQSPEHTTVMIKTIVTGEELKPLAP